jgi:hypothetical protein
LGKRRQWILRKSVVRGKKSSESVRKARSSTLQPCAIIINSCDRRSDVGLSIHRSIVLGALHIPREAGCLLVEQRERKSGGKRGVATDDEAEGGGGVGIAVLEVEARKGVEGDGGAPVKRGAVRGGEGLALPRFKKAKKKKKK